MMGARLGIVSLRLAKCKACGNGSLQYLLKKSFHAVEVARYFLVGDGVVDEVA